MHLAGESTVVEGVGHHGKQFVVLGIQTIEDGLGEFILRGETAEEPVACGGEGKVVDGVETGVGAEELEHLFVVVAYGADVVLLRPACLGVHYCHIVQECSPERFQFVGIQGPSHDRLVENVLYVQFREAVAMIERIHPVIGESAANGGEEIVTLLKGIQEVAV